MAKIKLTYPQQQRINQPDSRFHKLPMESIMDKRDKARRMNMIISRYVTPPSVSSVSVENALPTKWVFVFNEPVTLTDETGFTLDIDAVAATITGVVGDGTNTLTFTTTEIVALGDVLTFDYDSTTGDVTSTTTPKTLESVTGGAITNNVL